MSVRVAVIGNMPSDAFVSLGKPWVQDPAAAASFRREREDAISVPSPFPPSSLCCERRDVAGGVAFAVFDGWPFNRFSLYFMQGNQTQSVGWGWRTLRAAQRAAVSHCRAAVLLVDDFSPMDVEQAVKDKIWRAAA